MKKRTAPDRSCRPGLLTAVVTLSALRMVMPNSPALPMSRYKRRCVCFSNGRRRRLPHQASDHCRHWTGAEKRKALISQGSDC
ncbi:hypothetical protein X963_5412 [Burkholderia pseudomallei MSHR7498]|nr:hypothetical protein X963_5412 [Burkholderia pseudomallei MSHR7498]